MADTVLSAGDSLLAPIYELSARLQVYINLALSSLIEMICLWILRIVVYGIIFMALLFTTFLIITGPISIGISVIPMFSSSFSKILADTGEITNTGMFMQVMQAGTFNFGMVIVTMLVTAYGVTQTPTLCNMIISANGVSSAGGAFINSIKSRTISKITR